MSDAASRVTQMLRMPKILHAALLFSLAVYAFVGYVLLGSLSPEMPEAVLKNMTIGLAVIALIIVAGVIPILRSKMMPPQMSALTMDDPPDLNTKAATRVAGGFVIGNLLTWALCEAVGIFGLILTILSSDFRFILVFGGVAVAMMILYRPQRTHFENMLRAANRREDKA